MPLASKANTEFGRRKRAATIGEEGIGKENAHREDNEREEDSNWNNTEKLLQEQCYCNCNYIMLNDLILLTGM